MLFAIQGYKKYCAILKDERKINTTFSNVMAPKVTM